MSPTSPSCLPLCLTASATSVEEFPLIGSLRQRCDHALVFNCLHHKLLISQAKQSVLTEADPALTWRSVKPRIEINLIKPQAAHVFNMSRFSLGAGRGTANDRAHEQSLIGVYPYFSISGCSWQNEASAALVNVTSPKLPLEFQSDQRPPRKPSLIASSRLPLSISTFTLMGAGIRTTNANEIGRQEKRRNRKACSRKIDDEIT